MPDGGFVSLREALAVFAEMVGPEAEAEPDEDEPETGKVESQKHIKPLHAHIAARLVIEGGFLPDDVSPHPPLRIEGKPSRPRLVYAPEELGKEERTVYGGLKTKKIDVVAVKKDIGPVLSISVKGTGNAFRNLTNRMEEAAGDCTNIHITYPAMAYGFLHVMKANREADVAKKSDVAVLDGGKVVDSIRRYHDALLGLAKRLGVRNDFTRYEAVALALVRGETGRIGEVMQEYPTADSPLRIEGFFDTLYRVYETRFVYGAPALEKITRRVVWAKNSPALEQAVAAGFEPRTA